MTIEEKLKIAFRYALSWQIRTRGGMAGQCRTPYICLKCDPEKWNSDTNVPVFCPTCSEEIKNEALKERERTI